MKPESGFDPPPSLAAHPDPDGAGSVARSSSSQHDGSDGLSIRERLRNYRKSFRAAPGALRTFFRVLIEEAERHG